MDTGLMVNIGDVKKYFFYYDFLIGRIGIAERDGNITDVFFKNGPALMNGESENCETELIRKAAAQLEDYFAGKRKVFELPIKPDVGTQFMRKVWKALTDIPYGKTATYGEIAAAVGNYKAARAVGMANNKNPISIIVPCHRVIGTSGKLVGYAGGLDIKAKLLDLELKVSYYAK